MCIRDRYYEGAYEDSSHSFIRQKQSGARFLLSIGAFAHLYKRTGRAVSWAISPGAVSDTQLDVYKKQHRRLPPYHLVT